MTKTQHQSKPIYIEAAKPLAEKMFPDLDIDEYPKNLSFNQSFVHEFANELGQVCQNKNNTLNSTEFVNSIIFEYKQLLKEKMSQAFIINFLKLNAQYLPKQSSIKIIAFKKSIINAIFSNYIKSLKSTCNLPTGELETLESSIHSYDAQITLINHLNREQLDQLIFCFQELFDYQLFQSSLSNLNGSIPNHIELLMTPFIKQSDLFKEHLLEVLNQPTEDDQLGSQLPAEAKTPAPSDQNCLESVNVTPQQIDDLNQQSEDANIITTTSNLDNINDNICQLINVLNQTNSKNLDTSLNQYQIVLNKLNTKNDDPIVINFISGKDQTLANNVNHTITEFKDAIQSKNNDLIERHYRHLKIILSFINLHLEIADSSFELDSLRTTIHHSFKDFYDYKNADIQSEISAIISEQFPTNLHQIEQKIHQLDQLKLLIVNDNTSNVEWISKINQFISDFNQIKSIYEKYIFFLSNKIYYNDHSFRITTLLQQCLQLNIVMNEYKTSNLDSLISIFNGFEDSFNNEIKLIVTKKFPKNITKLKNMVTQLIDMRQSSNASRAQSPVLVNQYISELKMIESTYLKFKTNLDEESKNIALEQCLKINLLKDHYKVQSVEKLTQILNSFKN